MTHHRLLAGNPDAHTTASLARLMDAATGLTGGELDRLGAALGAGWRMVPHHDLDGERMAVIMPTADDPALPTWLVHREGALLRLDVVRRDTYTRVGAYSALAPLLASLRAAMEAASSR